MVRCVVAITESTISTAAETVEVTTARSAGTACSSPTSWHADRSWFPTDPGKLAVKSLYFFSGDVPDAVAERAYENSRSGWANDIEIWSNKRYMTRPLLAAGDGPVVRFRSWFDQFYE